MITLSVGCGKRQIEENVVRIDISPCVKPDVIWNLNHFPYPFENSSFSKIECFDVIEHLQSIPRTLEEFHRLLETNGVLQIVTPHFSSANSFVDPTHRWHLSYFSFDYFDEENSLSYYSKARFKVTSRHIFFDGGRINKSLIRRLANKFPATYEKRWTWIFPALFLSFELKAIK